MSVLRSRCAAECCNMQSAAHRAELLTRHGTYLYCRVRDMPFEQAVPAEFCSLDRSLCRCTFLDVDDR